LPERGTSCLGQEDRGRHKVKPVVGEEKGGSHRKLWLDGGTKIKQLTEEERLTAGEYG